MAIYLISLIGCMLKIVVLLGLSIVLERALRNFFFFKKKLLMAI